MFTPGTNEQLKEKLIAYTQDIYTMENLFNKTLEQYGEQVKNFKDFPEFQARIYQQADQTKQHITRLQERLNFYNAKPIAGKTTSGPLINLVNCFVSMQPTTFAGYASTWCSMEQFKIVSYRLLTTMAQTFGDQEIVRIAEQNLREEVETQHWLFDHLPEVCLYSLKYEGVTIPPTAWEFAKQLELVGTVNTLPVR